MNMKKLALPLVIALSLGASASFATIGTAIAKSSTPAPVAPPVAPPAKSSATTNSTTNATTNSTTNATTNGATTNGATTNGATTNGTTTNGTTTNATTNGTTNATTNGTTPAATPPIAPPSGNGIQTTHVSNPYGLGALWASGDIIARAALVILALMSMGSWYVMITKAVQQGKMLREGKVVAGDYWTRNSVRTAASTLKQGTAFQYVAQSGVDALDNHVGLLDKVDIASFAESSVQDGVDVVQSRMQEGLALLATVGSTAPFVGLFGTVWGIYHALTAIGIAGQASIGKVAGPVGEALIMTAIGLAVAVPAVFGYNILIRRNKRVMDQTRRFSKKVLFVLLSNDAATSRS